MDDPNDIEELPLVLVDALGLHIKHGVHSHLKETRASGGACLPHTTTLSHASAFLLPQRSPQFSYFRGTCSSLKMLTLLND